MKALLPLLFMLYFAPVLCAQTYVGTIKKDGWMPTAIQVDETHNKLFVADNATHKVFIFDGATLGELGSAPTNLDPSYAVTDMVVDESHQKLYAATFDLYISGKISVINTATGTFVKTISLAFPGTFSLLAKDEGLDKVYVLCNGGFGQIDVATDAVTWVSGVDGNPNRRFTVNPVTHEVFISNWMYSELDVVDGVTLEHTQIEDMRGLGVAVNWVENKVYVLYGQTNVPGVDYWCKVLDRDTGETTVLGPFDIDPTLMHFNPLTNRMYTSSEWLERMGIVDGSTNAVRRLPLRPIGSMSLGGGDFAVRNATDHVYYINDSPIEVLDPATELVERVAIETPGWGNGNVIYSQLLINQTTGRVYALPWTTDDPAAYNTVLVLQDTDQLARPPLFGGGVSVMDPVSKRWGKNLGLQTSAEDPGEFAQVGIAVSADGGRIYVPSESNFNEPSEASVSVVAGSGYWTVLTRIPTGGHRCVAAAVTPDGSRVYVTNSLSGDVGVIDTASNLLLTDVPVGTTPWGIAVSPNGAQAYVAIKDGNSVAVIDTGSSTVVGTIPVGTAPWGVTFNPGGTFAYVSNSGSNTVSVIDVAQGAVVADVAVGAVPHWLSVTPDGKQLYVTNSLAQSVSVINTETRQVIETIDLGADPFGVAVSPDGSEVFVSTTWYVQGEFGVPAAYAIIKTADFSISQSELASNGAGDAGFLVAVDLNSKFAGRVTMPGGSPAAAVVRAMQGETEKGTATTNSAGDYSIFNLPPGTYDIEVSASGCTPLTLTGLSVSRGRTNVLNPAFSGTECPLPIAVLSPHSLSFGWQLLSTSSQEKPVTLSNNGGVDMFITSISKVGGNAGDFSISHDCPISPSSLAAGNFCTINVNFAPTAPGPRKSALMIAGDASGSPHRIMLTGQGSAVSLSLSDWNFGSLPVQASSAPKVITLTNQGSTPIHVWSSAVTGVHTEDFSRTGNCPAPPATLAAGNSCTFNVTFTPKAAGAHTARFAISHDGGGTPASVSLTGTGTSLLQTQFTVPQTVVVPILPPIAVQTSDESAPAAGDKRKTKAVKKRSEPQ